MAATGKVLGTVTAVVGEAKATAADGTVRILQVGDQVFADEVITTSALGSINIALDSGKTLDCGGDTDLTLHESILAVGAAPAAPGIDVAALQAAIAAGADPTKIAEATAAGGAPAAGGTTDGGSHEPVILEQASSASVVAAGFATEGAGIVFGTPEFQLLPVGPVVSVTVSITEVGVGVDNAPAREVFATPDGVAIVEQTGAGSQPIAFVISLDQAFDLDVQVSYQIVPESAANPTDFFDGPISGTITIPAGQTSFSVPINIVRDSQDEGADTIEAGETFRIVLTDAVNATINPSMSFAVVTIIDDDAAVILTNLTVEEGSIATITASLTSAPVGTPLVVTLSNGATITFPVGQTTASGTFNVQGDDPYVDPETFALRIVSAEGGGFRGLDSSAMGTASVVDTIDTTTVSLAVTTAATEDDTSVTFTATLSNPGETAVTVTTNLGNIVIPAGQTQGTLVVNLTADPDVYVDPSSITATVSAVSGGNFEAVDFSQASATAQITDTIDTTTVSLSTGNVNEDAASVTFTATLSNPGETAVTLTTNLGNIVIPAGQTQGTLVVNTADPDVYVDSSSISATVSAVSGGNFEAVDFSAASATAQIADTIDTTTVSLSTGNVNEDAASVTFTATLSNPGETAVTLTTNLGNIVIPAGQTQGTLVVNTADPDVYVDSSSISATVSAVSGGNFEAVDFSAASATAQVLDTIDTTTVTLDDVTVKEDQTITYTASVDHAPQGAFDVTLNNGVVIHFEDGSLTGSSALQPAQGDDVYNDGESFEVSITGTSGGNYERLDTSSTATVQVNDTTNPVTVFMSVDPTDSVEGSGNITYTATLKDADGNLVTANNDITVTLQTGTITIAANSSSGTTTAPIPNVGDGGETVSNQVTAVSEANAGAPGSLESLGFDGAVVNTVITDRTPSDSTNDTITVEEESIPGIGGNDENDQLSYSKQGTFANNANWGGDGFGGVVSVNEIAAVDGVITVTDTVNQAWRLTVDASTGDYTFAMLKNLIGPSGATPAGADEDTVNLPTFSVIAQDGDGSKIGFNLNVGVVDDVPTLDVENLEVYRTAGTTPGTFDFSVGADEVAPGVSFAAGNALVWNNMPSGYTFTRVGDTYTAKLGSVEFFKITIDPVTSQYTFNLITPAQPSAETHTPNLFGALTLFDLEGDDDKTETGIIDASNFGGAFKLVLTGSANDGATYGGDTWLQKSDDDFGVKGNSIQESQNERLKLDVVRNDGFGKVTLTSLTIDLSSTGSIGEGNNPDQVDLRVVYENGDIVTVPEIYQDDSLKLVFDIDPTRVVDYVELIPVSSNVTLKITGFEVGYTTITDPADNQLEFNLTGVDADGDAATTNFTVNIMAGTVGADNIQTGNGPDSVSGGAGNDTISSGDGDDILVGGQGDDILVGGQGDDRMTGGLGADTFKWLAGDQGSTPAADTVMDFNPSIAADKDVLDLKDLLSGEHSAGSLATFVSFAPSGTTDVMLSVHTQGSGSVDQTILLKNVTMAELAGTHTLDSAGVIANLLEHGKLITDV